MKKRLIVVVIAIAAALGGYLALQNSHRATDEELVATLQRQLSNPDFRVAVLQSENGFTVISEYPMIDKGLEQLLEKRVVSFQNSRITLRASAQPIEILADSKLRRFLEQRTVPKPSVSITPTTASPEARGVVPRNEAKQQQPTQSPEPWSMADMIVWVVAICALVEGLRRGLPKFKRLLATKQRKTGTHHGSSIESTPSTKPENESTESTCLPSPDTAGEAVDE